MAAVVAPLSAQALRALQDLADRARQETGSRIVQVTHLNAATGRIDSLVWAGFGLELASAAIGVIRRLFPGFDPYAVSPHPDINPCNRRLYERGEVVRAPFDEVALNAVDPRVLSIAIAVGKIRESYMHPLHLRGSLFGALGLHAESFSPAAIERATGLVAEVEALLAEHWQAG